MLHFNDMMMWSVVNYTTLRGRTK